MSSAPVLAALRSAVWQLLAGPDRAAVVVPNRATRIGIWFGLAVLSLIDLVQLAGGGGDDQLVVTLLALAHAGAVGLALRLPLTGWRVSFVTTAVSPLLVSTAAVPGPTSTLVLHLGTLFLLAVTVPPAVAALAVAAALLGGAGWALAAGTPGAIVGIAAAPVLVAGLGAALRSLRGTATRLAEAERDTAAEQARRAVLEERTRIARELHDVVAHHLSAIAVRAESAPHRVPSAAPAAAEFTTIAGAARDALADMRRLLGVLRADDPDRPGAPLPTVDGIAGLVVGLRGSGMAVELEVAGTPRPVPGDVGLAAFRVAQEALSNAARHATGAAVSVRVRWLPDAVRVQVHNGAGEDAGSGGGTGLLGMRERVAAVGGFLVAGPGPDGYTVDATLPTGDRG
ncbi:signal transduction histidine kinase [Pseudonocardia hierapolitana]|uniref:histidine kinase n=1 Tax=Pseudonocardia hierapolitana TaxID=1128676 RepID=A0A561SIN1_9PSEU|nr:histidine kinase [Pseudonocardia hierapolitana]TWF74731.1 signal transduction histidine kinase [Pseudonocardia hierapolitana]